MYSVHDVPSVCIRPAPPTPRVFSVYPALLSQESSPHFIPASVLWEQSAAPSLEPVPTNTHIHTHIHTETNTHIHTHTYTHIHTHTHSHRDKHTHTHRDKHTHTYTHRDTHTHTQTNTHIHTQTNTYTHRDKHTHTDIQTQTHTQTLRPQTHTHTHRDKHTHTHTYINTHTNKQAHSHIHKHTHTHTHTHSHHKHAHTYTQRDKHTHPHYTHRWMHTHHTGPNTHTHTHIRDPAKFPDSLAVDSLGSIPLGMSFQQKKKNHTWPTLKTHTHTHAYTHDKPTTSSTTLWGWNRGGRMQVGGVSFFGCTGNLSAKGQTTSPPLPSFSSPPPASSNILPFWNQVRPQCSAASAPFCVCLLFEHFCERGNGGKGSFQQDWSWLHLRHFFCSYSGFWFSVLLISRIAIQLPLRFLWPFSKSKLKSSCEMF